MHKAVSPLWSEHASLELRSQQGQPTLKNFASQVTLTNRQHQASTLCTAGQVHGKLSPPYNTQPQAKIYKHISQACSFRPKDTLATSSTWSTNESIHSTVLFPPEAANQRALHMLSHRLRHSSHRAGKQVQILKTICLFRRSKFICATTGSGTIIFISSEAQFALVVLVPIHTGVPAWQGQTTGEVDPHSS